MEDVITTLTTELEAVKEAAAKMKKVKMTTEVSVSVFISSLNHIPKEGDQSKNL